MNNEPIKFFVGPTDGGKWVAATQQSPYCLLEGDTEQEVVEKAKRAIAFYNAEPRAPLKAREPKELSTFYPKRVVTADECVAA